jgi:hypothetical protein
VGEKIQISKIKEERGGITNTKEIIRDYFENLYSNKLENLDKMDKFWETYDHPRLNQEHINHLNRSITCNLIVAAIESSEKKF